MRVGILSLQGAFREHAKAVNSLGATPVSVRLPRDLDGLDALVIPGGESTTIGKLMESYHLTDAVKGLITEGLPVLGTCAGMILLSGQVIGNNGYSLGSMDITVQRNAFGRQVDSFEADLDIAVLGDKPFHAVFIRAPWIERVGHDVEILCALPNGIPVAAREGNLVVAAFHPELTDDSRFHAYFLSLVEVKRCKK